MELLKESNNSKSRVSNTTLILLTVVHCMFRELMEMSVPLSHLVTLRLQGLCGMETSIYYTISLSLSQNTGIIWFTDSK